MDNTQRISNYGGPGIRPGPQLRRVRHKSRSRKIHSHVRDPETGKLECQRCRPPKPVRLKLDNPVWRS